MCGITKRDSGSYLILYIYLLTLKIRFFLRLISNIDFVDSNRVADVK